MDYWTRGPVIGRGSTATVSLAASRSGEIFAVKSAELSQSQFLQREQQILSSINSPYIVSYKGSCISRENNQDLYNLFLEYVPGGTLSDVIRQRGNYLEDESMIGTYTKQILLGLNYLHSKGLVHCDIKGNNILISESGAKIADLGCAKPVINNNNHTKVGDRCLPTAGTPVYMAPEVARGEEQGCPADIWSLGCTIIEMVTGKSGWTNKLVGGGDDHPSITVLYQIAYSNQVPEIPSVLSEEAKDFLIKCLHRDPKQRLTANQLLQHPFIIKFASNCGNNMGKDEEFGSSIINTSPTSTLDQGIWNSVEDLSQSLNQDSIFLTDQDSLSSSTSANRRIMELSNTSSSVACNWEFNEDWINVR